jgi:hypothetical protein
VALPKDVVAITMSFYFPVHPIVLNTQFRLCISEYQGLSISRLVSLGAANKIEVAAADNYLSVRDH